MKKIVFYIIVIVAALSTLFTSCKEHEPAPPDPEPSPERSYRTILVYMVANNNLGSTGFDTDDLEEMLAAARVGALGRKNRLLVFHEAYGKNPVMKEVTTEGLVELKEYGPESAVEAATMRLALNDMRELAPADSYGLILWSHATGWIEDGITETRADSPAPLSFGLSGRKKMNIKTLADVLRWEDLEFLYFDCCYMMGIESLFQLRRAVPIIAGSPTELPSAGMPYDRTLPYFFRFGAADVVGAARETFDYYDSKTGSARTSTMSVIRTSALDALASATREIFKISKAGMPAAPFAPQRYSAVSTESCNYFDFAQYVRHLGASRPDLVETFDTALADVVVYEAATPYLWSSVPLTHHCGLSTYILPSYAAASERGYSTLEWWTAIASYLQQ